MKLAYEVSMPPGDVEINASPIILLHGMMDSRKTWKHLSKDFAKKTGRRVYAVDARNHGESPWSENFDFNILADDLNNFLMEHKITRAILVGHSMGGRTALTLALKKPEMVEKLIVEDMTAENFSSRSSKSLVQMFQLLKETLKFIPPGQNEIVAKKFIMSFLTKLLPPDHLSSKKDFHYDVSMMPFKVQNGEYMWEANLDAIVDFLNSEKMQQNLKGVYMGDALFLYGTKSLLRVKTDPSISKLFPHSRRVPIEGAGHLIHYEFPRRFVHQVVTFINGLASKY